MPPPDPPPWKEETKPAPVPSPAASPADDPFYHDPLVEAALEKFEGKIVTG